MAKTYWNIPWAVQNSQRRYPLTGDSTATDVSDSFKLPDDFIVGLNFPTHSGLDVDPAKFFIGEIGVYDSGFAVVVYYDALSRPIEVATAWINRQNHVKNQTYRLGGVGDYFDVVGTITIGRFDEIDNQPSGNFTFTVAGTRISPDAVRPMVRSVSSLSIVNGSETFGPFYGDIELVAEENMQITASVVSGEPTQIKFSAPGGGGLSVDCECDGDEEAPCIKRINGIPPTADGDFVILGSACLQVGALNNGLELVDVCSEPCCGCDELEEITEDLQRFGSKAVTLENFINNLESRVTQMDMVVLGSKLSDRGCFECEETP